MNEPWKKKGKVKRWGGETLGPVPGLSGWTLLLEELFYVIKMELTMVGSIESKPVAQPFNCRNQLRGSLFKFTVYRFGG
jgi:hypothetical protein